MPAEPTCTAADAPLDALVVGAAEVGLELEPDEGVVESLDPGALVVRGACAGAPELELEGAPDEAGGEDAVDEPEGSAGAVALGFIAFCWNALKDLSAVGFTAKTMPIWQWLTGVFWRQ
jgi:hypothetical protein